MKKATIKNLWINKPKFVSLLLAGTMTLSLVGCAKKVDKNDNQAPDNGIDYSDTMTYPVANQIDTFDGAIHYETSPAIPTDNQNEGAMRVLGCVANDVDVCDEWGTKKGFIEQFQLVSIIKNYGAYSFVEYYVEDANGVDEVRTGYIPNSSIIIMSNSFVEADWSKRQVRLYVNNELVLDTLTIPGTLQDSREGCFQVYEKKEDTELVGKNPDDTIKYVVPVDYWLGFDPEKYNGLHDAEFHYHEDTGEMHGWRSLAEFADKNTVFKKPSHGCWNLMNAAAKIIFENMEVGDNVVVHR